MGRAKCTQAYQTVTAIEGNSKAFSKQILNHAGLLDATVGGYARGKTDAIAKEWKGTEEAFHVDGCGCDGCD